MCLLFSKKINKKESHNNLVSHVSGHKSSRRNNHAGRAGGWKGTTITVPTKFGWLQWLPSQKKKQPNRPTVRQEKQLLLHNIWKPENTGMWCNAIKSVVWMSCGHKVFCCFPGKSTGKSPRRSPGRSCKKIFYKISKLLQEISKISKKISKKISRRILRNISLRITRQISR